MTMTPEQIEMHRKRFEDWHRRIYMNSPMVRDGDTYTTAHCKIMWDVWRSSIDSLVIELPEDDGTISQNAYKIDCIAHIQSQGIKVRP